MEHALRSRTRRSLFRAAAAFGIALAAGSAHAGPLVLARLDASFNGVPLSLTAPGAENGVLNGGFVNDPSSGLLWWLEPGVLDGTLAAQGPFGAPVTRVSARIEQGGIGVHATSGGSGSLLVSQGFRAVANVGAKFGKSPSFTLLEIPLGPSTRTESWVLGSLAAQALPTQWHLGPVTADGLTNGGQPLPSVMASGGLRFVATLPASATVSGTPVGSRCCGFELTLVTLRKVRLRGLVHQTTANPLTLRLYFLNEGNVEPELPPWFVVPEPESAPLLLGSAAVLVALGRARRRRAQ